MPLSSSLIKSRRMRWAGHVARLGEIINAYKILIRNSDGKRPGKITDLREIGWEDVDWMHLVQVRGQWRALVNMLMNLRVI
jgi:hypothetical protein